MVKAKNYTDKYLRKLDRELEMIPLTFDPVFKGVFESNLDLLKQFLLEVLDLNLKKEECNIKLLKKELLKENFKEYRKTVDIYILLNENIHIELELNRSSFKKVKLRNYLYSNKIYSTLLETGDDVRNLKEIYFYQLNLNTEDKTVTYGDDIIVPYGLKTKSIYIANHYTIIKYLEFYRNLYYTKNEILSDDEIWLAALTSKNFTELNEILSHILSDDDKNRLIGEVIRMSNDYFSIHEWEKEKCDELVRLESKRVDHEEGFQEGIEQGIEQGVKQGIQKNTTDMILSMLENNADLNFIAKVTKKSIKEIKEIQNQSL